MTSVRSGGLQPANITLHELGATQPSSSLDDANKRITKNRQTAAMANNKGNRELLGTAGCATIVAPSDAGAPVGTLIVMARAT